MNAAARELGLLAAIKARKPILERAQEMRLSLGLEPHPALVPPLLLSRTDMVRR